MFGIGGKKLIGLDVGSSAIKIISGTRGRKSFAVESLVAVPLPFRAKDERGIANPDALRGAIAQAFEQLGKKNPAIATSIYGPGVQVKHIIMPKIPKKEIPAQARFEAQQVFPSDVANILTDHVLIGAGVQVPGAPAGTPGWELLLVGVRQEEANLIYTLVNDVVGKVLVMDVDAFAVADFLDGLVDVPKKEAVAFIDVGASGTRVFVRYQGATVFVREFQLGGFHFTESIAQALGMTVENAESLKIQDGAGIPQEAVTALQGILNSWRSELRQCEDVFVSQAQNLLISKWYLLGGGSMTPGLRESLMGDRVGERLAPIDASSLFSAKSKTVNSEILSAWAPRLFSAAALNCRKA